MHSLTNTPNMIKINGENGGGQILRSALSLSIITGQAFHITHIRGKRRKGGLQRQHLTCVQAAAAISDASTDGATMGSGELIFNPTAIKSGDYHFSIGTAGSTSLLAQTLIPALLHADGTSTITLEGGTHNPMAPTADYLKQVFLPQLERMGASVQLDLLQHGFAPAGGGKIKVTIKPNKSLKPLHITEKGKELSRHIHCYLAHVHDSVADREISTAKELLKWDDSAETKIISAHDSSGPGNCLAIGINYENLSEIITTHGAYGKSGNIVAKTAVKSINNYLSSGAILGHQLADQLLLPMALAGEGSMIITTPSNHTKTNIEEINKFLGNSINITIKEHQAHLYILNIKRSMITKANHP